MAESTIDRIRNLQRRKDALILSHTYQPPEIQEIADVVGDSYGLSKEAAQAEKTGPIVFCGVRFMAETAAVLNPERSVLLPAPDAGCPMADMITAGQLRMLKERHPGAPVVCYVNSSVEVKAESTVCCTSSNAVRVVESLGETLEIIFVPDQYLGRFVERRTGRRLILWEGCCPVHERLTAETIRELRERYPEAHVLVHPECTPEVHDAADESLSTGQMIERVRGCSGESFIIGTEGGIVYTLRRKAPGCTFHHASADLLCPDMKRITTDNLLQTLETEEPTISVPVETARKARRAIERMIDVTERQQREP